MSTEAVTRPHRFQAYRVLVFQTIAVLLLACLAALWRHNIRFVYSILLGGSAVVLPNLYFASRFFARAHARFAQQIFRRFIWTAGVKIALAVSMLLLAFGFLHAAVIAVLLGFTVGCLSVMLLPMWPAACGGAS